MNIYKAFLRWLEGKHKTHPIVYTKPATAASTVTQTDAQEQPQEMHYWIDLKSGRLISPEQTVLTRSVFNNINRWNSNKPSFDELYHRVKSDSYLEGLVKAALGGRMSTFISVHDHRSSIGNILTQMRKDAGIIIVRPPTIPLAKKKK